MVCLKKSGVGYPWICPFPLGLLWILKEVSRLD
jgi:hypothetical protein